MIRKATSLVLSIVLLTSPIFAQKKNDQDQNVPRFDHVFVIMMENHAYGQIIGNPSAPFTNQYARSANLGTNYFAVAHPSLTNYLEVTGGSNFGILNDHSPDWHNTHCTTNLASGTTSFDNDTFPNVCPISGMGTDAATPLLDFLNEVPNCTYPCATPNPGVIGIDGVHAIPAAKNIVGETIADQLTATGLTWKSYQESLPPSGVDGVNNSDGFFTDASNIPAAIPGEQQSLIALYAVKHNPFVYFKSVQEGWNRRNSLANVAGFEGAQGLFEDLNAGNAPSYSFIVPNQCNDQHGRGNAGPQCDFDPNNNGTQVGLNPALIYAGDLALRNIVNAIHNSPIWQKGNNAIVVLWDENDYSVKPTLNRVALIVDTNYGSHGVQSSQYYTHFSLLKTIESGFGLPCLNHACDAGTNIMFDLFGGGRDDNNNN